MIDGKILKIGEKEYIVPPMNFKTLKKVLPKVSSWDKTDFKGPEATMDIISKFSEIILLALQRNYPDLTLDELEEHLTMKEINPIVEIVLEVSGLSRLGEKNPVAEKAEKDSNGEISTASSLPLLDITTEK